MVRSDTIGELKYATPLPRAMRRRFSAALIDVPFNSYCAPVLACNPNVGRLWQYTNAHHRQAGNS